MRKIIAYILITAAVVAGGATFKGISMQSKMRYYCVAQWPFDEDAADTTVEDSIGSYDGTASKNTEDMNAIGKINGALDFNGVNDCVDIGATLESFFQRDFSLSFWVNRSAGGVANRYIIYSCNVLSGTVLVDIDASSSEIDFGYYTVYAEYGKMINTGGLSVIGQWQHIVCVAKQTNPTTVTLSIYLNRVLVEEDTVSVSMGYYSGSSNLLLGNGAESGFYGIIDNVTIHNKALSQVEIDWLYNNGDGREL